MKEEERGQAGFHCQSQDHDKEMCLHVNQEDIGDTTGQSSYAIQK